MTSKAQVRTEQKTERQQMKEWNTYAYEQVPALNSRQRDLFAYLMVHRFPHVLPEDTYTKTWLLRIQSGAHFVHADEQTTRVLLEYHARTNNTIRQILDASE